MDDLIKLSVIGILAVIFGIYLIPVGMEALASVNTSNWTKVTGGSGAVAIYGLFGLIMVGGFAFAYLKGWLG